MLACKMRKANGKLSPKTLECLEAFSSGASTSGGNRPAKRQRSHPALEGRQSLDAGILNDVRKLGRLPRELRNKHRELTDEEKFERLLAERIRRNRNKLLPTTRVSFRRDAVGLQMDQPRQSEAR